MVKEKEVLNMPVHYQAMLEFFKEDEQDASFFLKWKIKTFF